MRCNVMVRKSSYLSINILYMDNYEKLISLLKEARDAIERFFADLFLGNPEIHEMSSVLKKEEEMYNPDGTLTEEYEDLMKKLASTMDPSRIDEALIAMAANPQEEDAIRSILGFVDDRGKLMEDYRLSISEFDGDAGAWVKDRACEGLEDEDKEARLKKIDEVLSSDDIIID